MTELTVTTPRRSNFILYYIGQATSAIGNGFVAVVFAFAALEVAPSGGLIPVVLLALWMSRMLLLPFASTFAEKRDKATVMLWADAGRLVSQLIVAIPFVLDRGAAWQMVVSASIYGACTAFFVPSSIALLPKIVDRDYLQRANGLLGIATNFGLVLGPALGALLVTVGGVAFALFVDVATFAVSVMTLAMLRTRAGNPSPIARTTDADEPIRFRDSLRIVPQVPGVFAVMVVFCFVQFGTAAVAVLGPLIASRSLGGIGAWSAIVTAMAAAALIGSAIATRLHVRHAVRWTLVAFGLFTPIELFALAIPLTLWIVVAVVLCTSVITEVGGVVFDTYVQRVVPQEYLARVGALESGLTGVMNPIGIAVAFPLASLFGTQALLLAAGASVLIIAGIAAFVVHLAEKRCRTITADTPLDDQDVDYTSAGVDHENPR